MDKYYSVIRYFINESLQCVQKTNWAEVPDFTAVLMQVPLNTSVTIFSKDLLYHITDIYIDELSKVQPNFVFTVRSSSKN